MPRCARSAALALAVVPILVLGACSSPEPEATPTPTPTGLSPEAWADAVCSSVSDLTTDIRSVADGLSVELGSGDALEQLETQLRANLATVGTSLEELTTTLGEAPGTDEGEALRDTLRTGADDVTSATDEAVAAAQDAAGSATVREFIGAAGTALTATSAAIDAADAFGSAVISDASAAGGALKAAFAEADSCVALKAGS